MLKTKIKQLKNKIASSLRYKILAIFWVIILGMSLIYTISPYISFKLSATRKSDELIEEVHKDYQVEIEHSKETLSNILTLMTQDQNLKVLIIAKDMTGLQAYSNTIYSSLHDRDSIDDFSFFTSQEELIYSHTNSPLPKQYESLHEKQPFVYLDLIDDKLSINGRTPITNGDQTLGYIRISQDFQYILEQINKFNKIDIAFYTNTDTLDSYPGNTIEKRNSLLLSTADQSVLDRCFTNGNAQAIAGKQGTLDKYDDNKRMITCGGFLATDTNGRPIGTAMVVADITDLISYLNTALLAVLSESLITVILAFFLSKIIITKVVIKPLFLLKDTADEIAAGNTDCKIDITTGDEIALLGDSINTMKDSLVQSNKFTNHIIETLPIAIAICDPKGVITKVNKAMVLLVEYDMNDLIGKPLDELFRTKRKTILDLQRHLDRENQTGDLRTAFVNSRGEEIPVSLSAKLLHDKQHKITGTLLVAKDLRELTTYAYKRLEAVTPIIQNITMGDFSKSIEIPEETDEFTEHFIGINLMIDDLRDMVSETEQKSEQLTEEKNKYQAVLQSIDEGVIAVDMNKQVILMNTLATDMLGVDLRKAIDMPIDNVLILCNKDRTQADQKPSQVLQKAFTTKKPIESNKKLYVRKNNDTIIPIDCTFAPVLSSDNKIVGGIIAFKDVSARAEAEKRTQHILSMESFLRKSSAKLISMNLDRALRSMLAELGKILDVSKIYICEFDHDHKSLHSPFEWVKPGTKPLRRQFQDIDPRVYPLWMKNIKEHKLIRMDDIEKWPDKDTVTLLKKNKAKSLIVLPLYIGKKTYGFIGVEEQRYKRAWSQEIMDTLTVASGIISAALKRQEDENFLKEINEMKSEFVSVASHQLRTPLSAMHWIIELLRDKQYGELSEKQEEFISQINGSLDKLIQLVNDLLNLSRIESGRIKANTEPTDIVEICEQLIYDLSKLAAQKKIGIQLKKPSQQDILFVLADKIHIRQVMLNLIGNAIKYTPENGKITIKIEQKKNNLLFSCSDSGIGIPQEQQKRIFSKFFRADNVVKTDAEGTGLGLHICRALILSFKGKIWFKSIEDEGTTFYFSIPIYQEKTLVKQTKSPASDLFAAADLNINPDLEGVEPDQIADQQPDIAMTSKNNT